MCMYACMYTCMYDTYVYICTHIYINICIHMWYYMHICIYIIWMTLGGHLVCIWATFESSLCVSLLSFVCIIVSTKNVITRDRFAAMAHPWCPDTEGYMPGLPAHQQPLLCMCVACMLYLYL